MIKPITPESEEFNYEEFIKTHPELKEEIDAMSDEELRDNLLSMEFEEQQSKKV